MSPRVAMVGAGYFAQFQLEGWADAGAPVQALCDLDAPRAQALAARHGVPTAYTDLATMLDAVQPTLLDVVLPPASQQAVVEIALARRIPVICQKPFGDDLAQAEAMTALAEQLKTPLVVHENFRFAPWFRECRRLIDAGLLGRVFGASFRLRTGDGQGLRAYLDRQPYFQTMPRLLVRETGVHFIDTFRYLLGEVRAVTARLRRLNPAIAGEDAALVQLEFDDARTGVFDGNRLNDHVAADPRRTLGEFWLEGEGGVLRMDGDARLWFKPHQAPEHEHVYDAGPTNRAFGGACGRLQTHVLAHLHSGAPLENGARDYLQNLYLQEAVYASHAQGRTLFLADFTPSS